MTANKGINRRIPINLTDALIRRFWSRVNIGRESECWLWTAAPRNNYGAIRHEGKVLQTHRLAYAIEHGDPDPSLVIAHKCDNRMCCNPAHLEAISPGQNNRDARGRCTFHMTRGDEHPASVLTENDVREIRRRHDDGERLATIAKDFAKVARCSVARAAKRITWRHVK